MTNLLSFNFFKTKSFKAISLALALSLTGSLMVLTNYQSNINTVNDSNKLSGFHITVKENNKNLISEANTWNLINNNYQEFIRIHKEQLITEQFNDWSDIINQVNINPNNDNFSKDVNSHFIEQIKNKENHILPDNGEQYFTNNIVGRSVAKQSLNGISSFGNVYVNYHDDTLPAQISNGLFATINPKADFNNYFSIPYMIKPSAEFLNIHQSIQDRLAILPLNNANPNDTNQPMIVILAKKSSDEQLLITVKNHDNVKIVDSDAVSYAILNHNPSDGLEATTFRINVKNSDYSKTISLTNNSSNLQFAATNSEHSEVAIQYLIQNNPQSNQNTLVIMNKVVDEAKVNINNQQQQWLKWRVDPQSLQKKKDDVGTLIKDGDILSLSQENDFQIYCIGLDTNDVQRQAASEQYIAVYRNTTKLPDFANCTDFFQKINDKPSTLLAGFQQYLTSANNSIKVEEIKAGEFLSWFIQYQGAITKQSYVNYLQSDNPDKPWNVDISLSTRTLVNNWNVVIIGGFIFSLLIIIPIVVVIVRKKKYLK